MTISLLLIDGCLYVCYSKTEVTAAVPEFSLETTAHAVIMHLNDCVMQTTNHPSHYDQIILRLVVAGVPQRATDV